MHIGTAKAKAAKGTHAPDPLPVPETSICSEVSPCPWHGCVEQEAPSSSSLQTSNDNAHFLLRNVNFEVIQSLWLLNAGSWMGCVRTEMSTEK